MVHHAPTHQPLKVVTDKVIVKLLAAAYYFQSIF